MIINQLVQDPYLQYKMIKRILKNTNYKSNSEISGQNASDFDGFINRKW